MERTKRISGQTLAIAILTLLLVASVLMTATGAWFTDSKTGGDEYTFGTITLEDAAATFTRTTVGDPNPDLLMPGDTFRIEFNVENIGSAQMWVRFKLDILVEDYVPAEHEGELDLFNKGLAAGGYTLEADGWWYRTAKLNAGVADPITINISIDEDIPQGTYMGKTVTMSLILEAVQTANNGESAVEAFA